MKILYAHLCDPNCRMGGAEQVVYDIATGIRDAGTAAAACVTNQSPFADLMTQKKIPFYEIFWEKSKTLATIQGLGKAIRAEKPDIIHSHNRYTTFLLDLFFKRGNRILLTQHVYHEDKKYFFRYGHFATGVSESVTNNLAEYYGVPRDRLRSIPNAVRVRPAIVERVEELKKKYPRRDGEIFAILPGRLEEQKGHAYLIEAVRMLPDAQRERIRIFFAGQGTLEPALKKKVSSAGIERNFIFLGYTADIPEYLTLCDFMVLPSLWEGMPLTVLEAYGLGRAVLATDIPGTREIVLPGRTGALVPPRDPSALSAELMRWLENPDLARLFGKEAQNYVSAHFSFDVMIENYSRLYNELIEKFPGAKK